MMWGGLDGLDYTDRQANGPVALDLCLTSLGIRSLRLETNATPFTAASSGSPYRP